MRFASLAAAAIVVLAAPFAAQAAEVTPLVTADWVKANVGNENVVILDIRDKVAETDLGELPYIANAVVAPYATAGWRTEVDGVPGQIPPV
jgi:thiosulfate/3-mercaptopyruvate sulfurtransferase